MNVIIIPVRAGSKGIPNKNLAEVHGVTLLERAIRTALLTTDSLVIVSTDGDSIADLASNYNVLIHRRSAENSQDSSTSESVIEEVIKGYPELFTTGTIVSLFQATSPFVTKESIDKCAEIARGGFTGFTARQSNVFVWEKQNLAWEPVGHPLDFRPRRQDRNPQVVETGGCYSFPLEKFLHNKYRFCSNPIPVLIGAVESIDIDDRDDLIFANSISGISQKDSNSKFLYFPKIIVTDFDGCLTNDTVIVNQYGEESVTVSRMDGLYIQKIKGLGVPIWILSSETNAVVSKRAEKIDVPCVQGAESKFAKMDEILNQEGLSWEDIWYVGNDLNDYEVMVNAGLSLCPSDSNSLIKSCADVVLTATGGSGIFREIYRLVEATKRGAETRN